MDAMKVTCVYVIIFFTKTILARYEIPDVMIQAFNDRGLRASIPDDSRLIKFSFHANINQPIKIGDKGSMVGETKKVIDKYSRWIVADPSVTIKVGDVINYYTEITVNEAGNIVVHKKELSYTVTKDTYSTCRPTATTLRKGNACSGQTVFRDDFNIIDPELWQIQQYIPFYSTEYPFVSYQSLMSNKPTVSAIGGSLRIRVKLQQNETGYNEASIYNGTLNLLEGCTSFPESCRMEAWGASILPPIVTGRITSKFTFTYGIVNVKAKLPQGDWLYPEILLEPFLKKYGSSRYRSGVIKIASALGNKVLQSSTLTDYSNKVLFGGPIVDFQCRDLFLKREVLNTGKKWSDDFHVYSLRWEPDRISLSVDGKGWLLLEPENTLHNLLPSQCEEALSSSLDSNNKMAPFDEHFQLTLGMGAGSITEFPDDVTTAGGRSKPWANGSRKAMLNFWKDKEAWLQTWNQPQLLVDYVEVIAL